MTLNVKFNKSITVAQQPASLIKLLTALVVRDWVSGGTLSTTVTVTAADAFTPTTAQLMTNDVLSYSDLIYGLLVPSGNDAALCLARNVGNLILTSEGLPLTDPVGRFLTAMGAKATSLGLSGAVCSTPHGVDTTSRLTMEQVVVLFQACLADSYLKTVMGTLTHLMTITGVNARTYNVTHTINPSGTVPLPEFIAGKTGTTVDAGSCVVMLYQIGGVDRISGVMNSTADPQRYVDLRALINYEIARSA